MRYHRAPRISGPEAAFLLESQGAASGRAMVVSCDGVWYDVRALSSKELEDIVSCSQPDRYLARDKLMASQAGGATSFCRGTTAKD
jgi:hypothetical protein